MEKFKILIADDLHQSREDFISFWELYFSGRYSADFTECETAEDALNTLKQLGINNEYFDIVVSDVDFTENQINESNIAGLEVIKKAKEINFKTQVIWYSAQKEQDLLRFKTEEWLRKNGFIDFSIRKAFLSDLFKETMIQCIDAVRKTRINLVIFLSKLFDTFNYGDDPEHNIGLYKLTHSNYKHIEMLRLLPATKTFFNDSVEKNFMEPPYMGRIYKYLENLETIYPSQEEMESFKSAFRLDFSKELLLSCQNPLMKKGVNINVVFQSSTIPRVYCEKERILTGFKTIYENLAKHNFTQGIENRSVNTTIKSNGSTISMVIEANGNSFDPKETFMNNRTAGLTTIYDIFNKYFDITYESKGISFNIYSNVTDESTLKEGVRISITIPLPALNVSTGGIEVV